MRKNILKISFNKLRKNDLRNFARRVINSVEGHDPETLKIKEIYDLLVELEPQIESLELRHLSHPLTGKMKGMRRQRVAFSQGIIDQIKLVEFGGKTNMDDALTIAKPIVLQHLQGFTKQTDIDVHENVMMFLYKAGNNEQLATALEALEVNSIIEDLKNVNQAIETHFNERSKIISERPKKKTLGITSSVRIALLDLFKQIEVGQVKNQELDYLPLIDELNEHIANYKAIFKTRASINKKKAEDALKNNETGETNGGIVIESSTEEPSESTQTTTQRMIPLSAGMDNESDLGQLDIKKTVAMSGKETRLPIVSTEA